MQEEKIAKIDIPNTKNGVLDLAALIFRLRMDYIITVYLQILWKYILPAGYIF